MKKILTIAAVLGLAACAAPQEETNLPDNVMVTGTNPIFNTQFAADPTSRVFNGKIYVFTVTEQCGSAWRTTTYSHQRILQHGLTMA